MIKVFYFSKPVPRHLFRLAFYYFLLLFLFINFVFTLNWTFWSFYSNKNECSSPNYVYKRMSNRYSKNHEILRRELDNSILQFYYYLSDQIHKNADNDVFGDFGERALDEYILLMSQSSNFAFSNDSVSEWHKSELKKLTDFIQERIYNLQHPESCIGAKILVCPLDVKNCGLACLIHRVGYCLRYAAISKRTMVIQNDREWKYSDQGWGLVYEPVSNCTYDNIFNKNEKQTNWTHIGQKDRITILPFNEKKLKRPEQVPLSFPKQFAGPLFTHHSNPAIWFGSQFHWYSSRVNQEMQSVINKAIDKINLNKDPLIGFHVRRTDKIIAEAKLIPIDEYFKWAELWYQVQERRNPGGPSLKRRVYIATDDLDVIEEAKDQYSHYEIYSNFEGIKSAQVETRYSDESLFQIVTDYEILSKCNYVVCTFSSNICRLVHEKMQIEKGDAEHMVHSLDDIYSNHLQQPHSYIAIEEHKASNSSELSFKVGDLINVKKGNGNLWNGYSQGFIKNTKKNGTYPTYKVREKWNIVDFPLFEP